jgi:hypothetical protein
MDLAGLAVAASVLAMWAGGRGDLPPPECQVGPVSRVFGGHEWNVFSCPGHRALLLRAADSSPARGAIILIIAERGDQRVEGNAEGDMKARIDGMLEAAHLGAAEFDALIDATRAASGH